MLAKGTWYADLAVCPVCGGFTYPRFHAANERHRSSFIKDNSDWPFVCQVEKVRGYHHNHMHCRCGFEWTLPPRNKVEFESALGIKKEPTSNKEAGSGFWNFLSRIFGGLSLW